MRVLDLDLDFFAYGTAHHVSYRTQERLDPDEYPPWPTDQALAFLTDQCLLTEKLPGRVVEHHSELFYLWGQHIEEGLITGPLEVVHVDAHADLGMGDAAYSYILTELAFERIEDRWAIMKKRGRASRDEMSDIGAYAVNDGNWLAFAVACGWFSHLTYVWYTESTGEGRPTDLVNYLMKDYGYDSGHLQVAAVTREALERSFGGRGPEPIRRDPPVPFAWSPWRGYQARQPFDMVFLTRSPEYTSSRADPIFDEIRKRFIDEGPRL